MSKKANVEKVTGTVEVAVDARLETINGFTSEECVSAIKNKQMQSAVRAYAKAFVAGRKSDWDRAKAISRMTVDMIKEFGDEGQLAEFLGLNSKSEFSKLKRAGALAIEAEKRGIKTMPSLSVVTEMLVLEGKKYGEQNLLTAVEYANENESTVAEIRDYVKTFKKTEKKNESLDNPNNKVSKKCDKKTVKPDAQGNVEGKVNESPLPNLDTVLVWVDGKTLAAMSEKDRAQLAHEINTVLDRFAIGAAVLTEC